LALDLDICVTPTDLAAESHGNDHAEDDDDGGGDADAHDANLIHAERRIHFIHDRGSAVGREGARRRRRSPGGRSGRRAGSARIAGSGSGRDRCGRRCGRSASGLLRVAGGVILLSGFEETALEILLDVVDGLLELGVGIVTLLHLGQALVQDFLENGLIAGGHDGAGDHQDEDEQQGEEEEGEQALIFFGGAAAAEEADDHDADADDDEQDGRLFDLVRVESGNVQLEDVGEVVVDGGPNADHDRRDPHEEENEGEEKEDVFEESVAAF